MICLHILLMTFFNKPELIFWHIVKWFQVLLSNNNSTNSEMVTSIHLYIVKCIQVLLYNTNNPF